HTPDDIALALLMLAPDDCAGSTRIVYCAVAGIVVVHVDSGFRQRRPEIGYDFGNSDFLIVTRHQHCDARRGSAQFRLSRRLSVQHWLWSNLASTQLIAGAAHN